MSADRRRVPGALPGDGSRSRRLVGAVLRLVPIPSWSRLRDAAGATFWLIPALSTALAILMGIGLVMLDGLLPLHHALIVFPGPPQAARSLLSAIIQAMISFSSSPPSSTPWWCCGPCGAARPTSPCPASP